MNTTRHPALRVSLRSSESRNGATRERGVPSECGVSRSVAGRTPGEIPTSGGARIRLRPVGQQTRERRPVARVHASLCEASRRRCGREGEPEGPTTGRRNDAMGRTRCAGCTRTADSLAATDEYQISQHRQVDRVGVCPPSPRCGYGVTAFVWLAKPKLTLRGSQAGANDGAEGGTRTPTVFGSNLGARQEVRQLRAGLAPRPPRRES